MHTRSPGSVAGKRITYFDRPCSPRNSTIIRFDARGRMTAAAGKRTRYDYEVKAGSAFNSRHKAPRCVLSKQPSVHSLTPNSLKQITRIAVTENNGCWLHFTCATRECFYIYTYQTRITKRDNKLLSSNSYFS